MDTFLKFTLLFILIFTLFFVLLAPTQLVVAVLSRIFWFAKRLVFASIGASAFALFFAILNPQLGFVKWMSL